MVAQLLGLGCFQRGPGPPAAAHVWKVMGRVGAPAKLRLSSSGHGVTAGEETWPVSPSCPELFPPHPSRAADPVRAFFGS